LGYRLYHELKHHNVEFVILAPTSMAPPMQANVVNLSRCERYCEMIV